MDQVKTTHLIAKLRESARSRINSLTPEQKQSFKDIVELLKRLLLYIRSTVFMTQLIQLKIMLGCVHGGESMSLFCLKLPKPKLIFCSNLNLSKT